MSDCRTCKHARFDELWGEYKCMVMAKRVKLRDRINCQHHKKKDDKEKKV